MDNEESERSFVERPISICMERELASTGKDATEGEMEREKERERDH